MAMDNCNNRQDTKNYQVVRSKADLVNDSPVQLAVNQISELVAVPAPHFQTFYLSAIANYLSMTQHVPHEVICTRLQTITDGLKLRRSLVLPFDASPELASEQHDIWTYAVFISLLMYNLAPEVLGYEVIVQQDSSDALTRWHPLIIPLEPSSCFRVVGTLPTSKYASLMLMPTIIGDLGLQWISENSLIFNTTLELIVSPAPSNKLGALIYQAYRLESDKLTDISASPIRSAAATPEHSAKAPANIRPPKNMGTQFRRWLMTGISGTKKEKNIVTTERGVALIYPDIFKQYAKEQGIVSWETVETEFLKLNLHAINPSSQDHIHRLQIPGMGKRDALLITSMKKQ